MVVAVAGSLAAFPGQALAEENPTRFEAAVRTGILIPMGSATGYAADTLSNTFGDQFAMAFDVGYRLRPSLIVGGYFGLAAGGAGGTTSDDCDRAGASCFGRSSRMGAQIQWRINPKQRTHVWLGYGVGYEWSSLVMSGPKGSQSVSFRGPEYGHFLMGVDFPSLGFFRLGLVVDMSFSSYSTMDIKSWASSRKTTAIEESGMHQWVMLGIRGILAP
jgi:hypothetical protein